ncbi:hypothetical protein RvY_10783 [Ramazzottius varieornatus]|uniref:Uncharacterized protein n=1 Tax=Ramazzottius varieornatus TaxID=947166 RepID=A0A1D1VID7_RAMVA|nr:hypothetical protein RvY_10783 [Ramazzottius varieornatus]
MQARMVTGTHTNAMRIAAFNCADTLRDEINKFTIVVGTISGDYLAVYSKTVSTFTLCRSHFTVFWEDSEFGGPNTNRDMYRCGAHFRKFLLSYEKEDLDEKTRYQKLYKAMVYFDKIEVPQTL